MRHAHMKTAIDMGVDEDKIFTPDNGQYIELYNDRVEVPEKFIELDTVMIDGNGMGSMTGEYVMKARHIMAHNGLV